MSINLEVADIFRSHGSHWRKVNAGHISLGQLKVMSAIKHCRTAELGGHVERCADCSHTIIAYNSCRNRHCPKCQGATARKWLEVQQAYLLDVPYYHVVFILPAAIADIAYQNKSIIYDLLFKVSSQTMLTIAADKKHLGAKIGMTSVLHTWGSALTHHPHIHMIVPGGGINEDGRWISCKPGFFLSVRVLSRLFRRLFLEQLVAAHKAGKLKFFGKHASLSDINAFTDFLKPHQKSDWVIYAKQPFAGPETVLAYLSRYTHRVAISNSRLIKMENSNVTFKYKDYRQSGKERQKLMTLTVHEFIRRFLIHVLPHRFHRIRHTGLFASQSRKASIDHIRRQLHHPNGPSETVEDANNATEKKRNTCPCCGGIMFVIETFEPRQRPKSQQPRYWPPPNWKKA
ncbi:IS91 family transposase [Lentilitoribacter sp. Alg239-R112]|uniref:IS91 family transposase n=1 Tax=Lentilitoribacter sp. Alg239-R112 TaxID=2305987 RepID=UPI0013A6EC86|nr:IS91 family transposase [Lentilitoribacter sp. Alg239-R112]